MADKIEIEVTQSVVAPDGQRISETRKIEVEAYDKIEVVLPKKETSPIPISVQPGDEGQVKFFLIKADKYYDNLISYSIGEAKSGNTKIPLDGLHIISTSGLLGLLPATPKKLYFHNSTDEDVAISILVGRNAMTRTESESSEPAQITSESE